MADARVLLERHKPRLAYDALEAYFADSAAIWTDSPANVLKRADGTVLARAPQLSLADLGPHVYADGRRVLAGDSIGETTRDYAKHAAALHRDPKYGNRVHGHARSDRNGRLWLQYWLFYYYNDFLLAGPFTAGDHEGDWELVQIRLGPSEQPEQAVYGQHKSAESKAWKDVPKAPNAPATPLVYVARGSHANYFEPGSHWTGVWFDEADGRGPAITPTLEVLGDSQPAWTQWPGSWGDTKPTCSPLDSSSPLSPGRRPHWLDPSAFATAASKTVTKPAPATPAAPEIQARRLGDRIVVTHDAPPGASAIVVGIRPEGSTEPAVTRAIAAGAAVEFPADARSHEVWASAVAPGNVASASVGTQA